MFLSVLSFTEGYKPVEKVVPDLSSTSPSKALVKETVFLKAEGRPYTITIHKCCLDSDNGSSKKVANFKINGIFNDKLFKALLKHGPLSYTTKVKIRKREKGEGVEVRYFSAKINHVEKQEDLQGILNTVFSVVKYSESDRERIITFTKKTHETLLSAIMQRKQLMQQIEYLPPMPPARLTLLGDLALLPASEKVNAVIKNIIVEYYSRYSIPAFFLYGHLREINADEIAKKVSEGYYEDPALASAWQGRFKLVITAS